MSVIPRLARKRSSSSRQWFRFFPDATASCGEEGVDVWVRCSGLGRRFAATPRRRIAATPGRIRAATPLQRHARLVALLTGGGRIFAATPLGVVGSAADGFELVEVG